VKRKKREAEEGGREKEGDRDRNTERVTVCQIQGDTEIQRLKTEEEKQRGREIETDCERVKEIER
jgi:hypothetical protein